MESVTPKSFPIIFWWFLAVIKAENFTPVLGTVLYLTGGCWLVF